MSDFDLGYADDQQPSKRELTTEERQFIKDKPSKKKDVRKVRMTVDVPEDEHMHIKMLANRNRRPMSQELYLALEAWLKREKNQL